jgi:hypothetical protein
MQGCDPDLASRTASGLERYVRSKLKFPHMFLQTGP